MIATLVFVDVKPENIEEFRAITIYNHDNTRKEAGNVRFDVLQDNNDPTKFVLYEVFRDTDAAAEQRQAEEKLEDLAAAEKLIASRLAAFNGDK